MSRISLLLIVPLIIAILLFSMGQLKASDLDPAGPSVFWPSSGLAPTGTGPDPADLSITKSVSGGPAVVGGTLTYYIIVTNNSATVDAENVTVTDNLPLDVNLISATPSQGSCSGTSSISCNLGTLNNGLIATITVNVTLIKTGTITNTATVSADNSDAFPGNNSATVVTIVVARVYLPIIKK